jgi:PHD/YefM family antitoxin component YafN of YafNO toxin-antitoxin module
MLLFASKIIKQIKATKQPVVLIVNGKADAVILDAESYQNLVEAKERLETVAVLRERLKSLDESVKGVPMEEVFSELAKEHGFKLEDDEA